MAIEVRPVGQEPRAGSPRSSSRAGSVPGLIA